MSAPLVVFMVGNPSRGDDALGPAVCAQLAGMLEKRRQAAAVELIEDFQLNIEHALDLCGRQLALFIDAGDHTPGPFVFAPLIPSTAIGHATHALEPDCVLGVYRQTEQVEPPPAFVLCIRGESFELGDELSPAARTNLDAALAFVERLLDRPTPAAWAELAAEA